MDPINYLSVFHVSEWHELIHIKFQIYENMHPNIDLHTSQVLQESNSVYIVLIKGFVGFVSRIRLHLVWSNGPGFTSGVGYH